MLCNMWLQAPLARNISYFSKKIYLKEIRYYVLVSGLKFLPMCKMLELMPYERCDLYKD